MTLTNAAINLSLTGGRGKSRRECEGADIRGRTRNVGRDGAGLSPARRRILRSHARRARRDSRWILRGARRARPRSPRVPGGARLRRQAGPGVGPRRSRPRGERRGSARPAPSRAFPRVGGRRGDGRRRGSRVAREPIVAMPGQRKRGGIGARPDRVPADRMPDGPEGGRGRFGGRSGRGAAPRGLRRRGPRRHPSGGRQHPRRCGTRRRGSRPTRRPTGRHPEGRARDASAGSSWDRRPQGWDRGRATPPRRPADRPGAGARGRRDRSREGARGSLGEGPRGGRCGRMRAAGTGGPRALTAGSRATGRSAPRSRRPVLGRTIGAPILGEAASRAESLCRRRRWAPPAVPPPAAPASRVEGGARTRGLVSAAPAVALGGACPAAGVRMAVLAGTIGRGGGARFIRAPKTPPSAEPLGAGRPRRPFSLRRGGGAPDHHGGSSRRRRSRAVIGAGRHERSSDRTTPSRRRGAGRGASRRPKLGTGSHGPGSPRAPRAAREGPRGRRPRRAWIAGAASRQVGASVRAMGTSGLARSWASEPCRGIDERADAFPTHAPEGAQPCLRLGATHGSL